MHLAGRPTATSIAVVVNWTANFLVGLGFLPMRVSSSNWSPQTLGPRVLFFSFVCLVVVIALVLVAVAQHPLFQLLMGPWVFMVFIVIQLFFIIYVAIVVPETKGRQIDEITALFRK